MCGRTVLSLSKDNICCACSYKPKGSDKFIKPQWVKEYNDGKEYAPSYNIAPTAVTPVIVPASSFAISPECERIIKPMMWGMIPPWQEGNYLNHKLSTNNCRIENITTSKLYNPALQNGNRCIIAVEGFYEWQTKNHSSKTKQPYYFYAKQNANLEVDKQDTWVNSFTAESGWTGIQMLYLAGLYNVWNKGTTIYSYSVITMDSNSTMNWLHERMPAILETEQQIQAWLDVDNVKPEKALTYLSPANTLKWHPVSTNVNNTRYKAEDCNRRIILNQSLGSQKTLTSWFTKTNKRVVQDQTNSESESKKKKM